MDIDSRTAEVIAQSDSLRIANVAAHLAVAQEFCSNLYLNTGLLRDTQQIASLLLDPNQRFTNQERRAREFEVGLGGLGRVLSSTDVPEDLLGTYTARQKLSSRTLQTDEQVVTRHTYAQLLDTGFIETTRNRQFVSPIGSAACLVLWPYNVRVSADFATREAVSVQIDRATEQFAKLNLSHGLSFDPELYEDGTTASRGLHGWYNEINVRCRNIEKRTNSSDSL